MLVDTMVVSALVTEGRDPAPAAELRRLIDGRSVVVSSVIVTEMRYGALKANWGELRRGELERTLSRLVAVQPDDELITACSRAARSLLSTAILMSPLVAIESTHLGHVHEVFVRLPPRVVLASRMRWLSPSVTTTTAWWRSRSRSEAAVVCSGRNRPQASKGQWLAMPRLRRS